jgi:hypothetical protein
MCLKTIIIIIIIIIIIVYSMFFSRGYAMKKYDFMNLKIVCCFLALLHYFVVV